jgi:hypothetical protein
VTCENCAATLAALTAERDEALAACARHLEDLNAALHLRNDATAEREQLREALGALSIEIGGIATWRTEHAHPNDGPEHARADSEAWCAHRLLALLAPPSVHPASERPNATAAAEAERDQLREALRRLFALVEDGTLVRDISKDSEPGFAIRQIPFVMALRNAQAALAHPSAHPASERPSATGAPGAEAPAKSDVASDSAAAPDTAKEGREP